MQRSLRPALASSLCLMLVVTGCQGSRALSRSDYRSLHDPFVDVPGAGAATAESDGSAVTRMADASMMRSTSDRAPQPIAGGPKPIGSPGRPTGRDGAPPIARATYPGAESTPPKKDRARYPGPSLSDFMSSPEAADESAATPARDSASASTRQLSEFAKSLEDLAQPVPWTADAGVAEAVSAAAAPSAEWAAPPESPVAATDEGADFESWIATQREQWAESVVNASADDGVPVDNANADPGAFRLGAGTSAALGARRTVDDSAVTDDFLVDESPVAATDGRRAPPSPIAATPTFDEEFAELVRNAPAADRRTAAMGLQQSPFGASDAAQSEVPRSQDSEQGPAVEGRMNVARSGHPAEEFGRDSDVRLTSGEADGSEGALDAGFLSDSGWKPLHRAGR